MASTKTRFSAGTAPLRVGRARLALLAWLAAQQAHAPFVLRLAGDAMPPDLAWLGIATDYIVRPPQDRADALQKLRHSGRLYPCFETEQELRWKREQRVRRRQPPVYDRAMLKLTAAQRATAEAGGKRPYWRFRLSDSEIAWRDRVAGPQTVKLTAVSDPVVVAPDGMVSASLAAAIDDAADGIGLLIRDAARIEASGLHLDMLAALGADPAALALAHLPPLPDAVARLSLRRLRQDGVEPAALATLLAAPGAPATLTAAERVGGFDLSAAGRTEAVDLDRLRALNRTALAALPYEAVAERLPEGAHEPFWVAVRGGIDLLSEARHWWAVTTDDFLPPPGKAAHLAAALASLPAEPWNASTWRHWGVRDEAALRLALTGEETGPDMAGLLPLIGRVRAERRLRLAS